MTTPNTSAKTLQVSLVLPAYNEVDYLTSAVEKTMPVLDEIADSYEIIIAEDGSTDGTAERSKELAQKYPCVTAYSPGPAPRQGHSVNQRV